MTIMYIDYNKWCASQLALQEKRAGFVLLAHFYAITTPVMATFKVHGTSRNVELEGDVPNLLWEAIKASSGTPLIERWVLSKDLTHTT